MRGRKPLFVISLSEEARTRLEGLQRRPSAAAGEARRARLIVLLDKGQTLKAAAAQVGMTVRNARKWIWRFIEEGVAGLKDRRRPGRKPIFSP